jgi:Ca2+-binding RTX toxin-like protein
MAGVIVAALAGAAPSQAATSVGTYPPVREPHAHVAGGVFIRGDSLSSQVRVGYDAGADEFVVQDSRRPLKIRPRDGAPEQCRLISRHVARCPNPERSVTAAAVTVRLRAGPDFLLPKRSLTAQIAANGGPGVDEVNGAAGEDFLTGGPGTDVVRGLAGDDELLGKAGDVLSAGDGDDTILADFGSLERSIDCGAGEDRAFVDPDDVETFGCETVRP